MVNPRFEIMVDVLSSAKGGANKTKIVYDAYLNFKQAAEYLNLLLESSLLTIGSDGNKKVYYTTNEGEKMLEKYKELIELKTRFD